MGRSAAVVPESHEKSLDVKSVDVSTLDDEIASILAAIEEEKVPERLLSLASMLQEALVQQRQRQNPN